MGSTRFLLQALVHGRNTKNRKPATKKSKSGLDCVEKGIDTTHIEDSEKIDDDGVQSMGFKFLYYWGLFEMMILSLVLLASGRMDRGSQVIHNLCEEDSCHKYILNGLIIRLLLALYMTLGAYRSSWVLCLPWLLIDSLGFFPFIPIILSAFVKYSDIWIYYHTSTNVS